MLQSSEIIEELQTGFASEISGIDPVRCLVDTTAKFVVQFHDRADAFLSLSNTLNPDRVERDVQHARRAKESLPSECQGVFLDPLKSGYMHGLSYALFERHQSLHSSRLILAFQKRWLAPKVFRWLRSVCKETLRKNLTNEEIHAGFVSPLSLLAEDVRFTDGLRNMAGRGLERLSAGQWRPVHVLQHSDLWLGNVLIPSQRGPSHFYLIDWAGSKISGYPFFDLVQFAMSMHASKRRLHSEVTMHATLLGSCREDFIFPILAALGQLGAHLEHFPEERYVKMTKNIFNVCERVG